MIAAAVRALSRIRSDERGVTIIEGVVAALILAVGALAVLGMVDASTRNAYRTEQSQVVENRLQLELEKVRQLEYSEVGLTELPASSADQELPGYRVSATGARFALDSDGGDPADIVTGGSLTPGPTTFTSGDITGRIWRYVTWQNDDTCPETLCPGNQDLKRVVIVAKADTTAAGGERAYQELQSDFVDPEAEPVSNALAPTPTSITSVPYSLSDTTCDRSARVAPSDHAAHNTLGLCSDGLRTGSAAGAPDRLFKNATPGGLTTEFDFATDVEPSLNPTADRGLQLVPQSGGCQFSPSGGQAPRQVHRWLTAPVGGSSDLVLESASLKLYTKTLNSTLRGGHVCAFLFVRETNVRDQAVDRKIINSTTGADHFTYTSGSWPASWGVVTVGPMNFGRIRVSPGDRVGLALALDASAGADPLQFLYNHSTLDSQLTLNTTTPSAAPN